jgi:3-oxoadipate enol-lactonase
MMVPVPGGQVWAEDTAPAGPAGGVRESGEAVVLLHPGWGDSRIWDPLLAHLPGQRRVVRYDTRGYRGSPPPAAPFSQLGDVTAVLDRLDVARAVMVGHSGGGGTAVSFALAHPDRVSALVLLAPGVQDYPWPKDDPYGPAFMAAFTSGDEDALTALGLRTWAAASADPAAKAQIRSAAAAFLQQGEFEQPDPPAFARLAEIRAPAALVVGDLEYPMVDRCARAIAARIPGCRLTVVPGADHMLPLRVPGLIAGLITSLA